MSSVTRCGDGRRARRGGGACRGRGGRSGRARAARRARRASSSGGGSRPAVASRSSSSRAAGESGAGSARLGGSGAGGGFGLRLAPLQPREPGEEVAARAVARRVGIEHDPAPERVRRRQRPDHQPVAAGGHQRLLEPELEVAAAELREPGGRLARAVVHGDARAAVRPRVGGDPRERRRRRGTAATRRRRRRATTTSPRATSSRPTPARFSATRWPASARSRGSSWTCTERTRAERPDGRIRTSSPRAAAPSHSVPVTTVPAPRIVNERSTCSRSAPPPLRPGSAGGDPVERRAQLVQPLAAGRRDRHDLRARQQRRRLLARARGVGEVGLRDRHHARRRRPSAASTAACSRVWGITPSSAATTIRYRSMPVAPATIVRTKRSCPGHVDHRQPAAGRQVERRVAELDRDPALALLRQPVGVDARERADEHGLAVVDVAGGPEGERVHRRNCVVPCGP